MNISSTSVNFKLTLQFSCNNHTQKHSRRTKVATPTPRTILTKTWPPPLRLPPPPASSYTSTAAFQVDQANMFGLHHNIFLIAPSPSSFHHLQHIQPLPGSGPPPPFSSDQQQITSTTTNDQSNIVPNNQDSWTSLKRYQQQQESGFAKKDALNVDQGNQDTDTSSRVCRDCGNRAKKECEHRRCRTCCKGRGYNCATHVKSTWVSVARRRDRLGVVGGSGGSSGSSSGGCGVGGKRPRENVATTSNSTSNNNTHAAAASSFSMDTGSSHQDARFKQSLPGQVRAPAVFRCIRVTAINGNEGEAEIAYQAMVNISGHVFKGFLYDQGIDEKNMFPCISRMHSTEKNRDSSSPIVDPRPNALAASTN